MYSRTGDPALLGGIMKDKSIYNVCPVCGLPRGKGPHEFAHGPCLEQRAKTDGKELMYPGHEKVGHITVEQREKGRRDNVAKKYKAGKLPIWMFS
jgi:hypothetical protein